MKFGKWSFEALGRQLMANSAPERQQVCGVRSSNDIILKEIATTSVSLLVHS